MASWVLPVYGALVGTLLGFGVGYLSWRLSADPKLLCVDMPNRGRCPSEATAERWTMVGGAVGTAVGLAIGCVLQVLCRRQE
jgi:hypothetical protein